MQIQFPKDRTIYPDFLMLGVQTGESNVIIETHYKCLVWSPKKARSYTIENFRFTDYHGATVDTLSGYASFIVKYFTTTKEGKYPIIKNKENE